MVAPDERVVVLVERRDCKLVREVDEVRKEPVGHGEAGRWRGFEGCGCAEGGGYVRASPGEQSGKVSGLKSRRETCAASGRHIHMCMCLPLANVTPQECDSRIAVCVASLFRA